MLELNQLTLKEVVGGRCECSCGNIKAGWASSPYECDEWCYHSPAGSGTCIEEKSEPVFPAVDSSCNCVCDPNDPRDRSFRVSSPAECESRCGPSGYCF